MVPKKLFVTIGAIAAACVAVIAAFSSEKTINYANAVSTQKEFFLIKTLPVKWNMAATQLPLSAM